MRRWSVTLSKRAAFIRGGIFASLFALVVIANTAGAATTLPTKMNFQGRLANSAGNILTNGTYNMRFRIYDAASGGTVQWSEDRLVSAGQGVTVTNGQFSVQLGSVTSLPASVFASNSRYFEVELPTPGTATTSSPSWTEGAMTPRNQLATSAYAYNAETLDGIDGSSFGQLSTANIWTNTNTFRPSSNSTSSFAIQTSGSANLLVADSTNSRVYVGDPTADANGVVLVLDTKNTAGDPTGVNGAMYYNSNSHSFRCYKNGAWRNCLGSLAYSNTVVSNAVVNTVTETNFDKNYTIPAGDCQPGKVYRVTARGVFSTQNWGLMAASNLTVRVKLGAVVVGTTGVVNPTANRVNRQWLLDFTLTCLDAGSSGSVEGQGIFNLFTAANAVTTVEILNTASVGGINFTTPQTLQLSAEWSTAYANSTIILRQLVVEELGS